MSIGGSAWEESPLPWQASTFNSLHVLTFRFFRIAATHTDTTAITTMTATAAPAM